MFDRVKWHKEYRRRHRDKINHQQRERRKEDPEKYRSVELRYRRTHPEIYAKRYKRYGKAYRAKNHVHILVQEQAQRDKIRSNLFAMYGNACSRCAFSDPRALQLDHVTPPKEKYGEYLRCGLSLYQAVLRGARDKKDFQLLCANCNWIKRSEHNEHNRVSRQKFNRFSRQNS